MTQANMREFAAMQKIVVISLERILRIKDDLYPHKADP